jgi:hypothetical protein
MAIKASAAVEIQTLVDALAGDDDVRREAAIARLGIIGPRAVDRLIESYAATANRRTHTAILRALEGIGDVRSATLARSALGEGGDVAVAAAGVLKTVLASQHAATATGALDALVATSLDEKTDRRVRLAAFDALQDMPAEIRARVKQALEADVADDGQSIIRDVDVDSARLDLELAAVWSDAIAGHLPDSPEMLRDALDRRGASTPLNVLRRLIEAIREHETEDSAVSACWRAVRGAVHQTLALRGSRVALYDLRETIEAATAPLPTPFLTALHVIGDVSCLEPVAAAWGTAAQVGNEAGERWRQQLASAFRAIVEREKITKRHAVIKRVAAKWPGLV